MSRKPEAMTTAAGIPVADNQNSLTIGLCGPPLVQGSRLIKKLVRHWMPLARTISYIGIRAASRTE